MENQRHPGLVARNYLTAALVLILLIWGPLDHSWPAWLAIRTGYLIAIPVATWWLLKWIWKAWQPDIAIEERIVRALFAATAGGLLVTALNEGSAKTHVGGPEWDREVLPGPDLAGLLMVLLFAGIFFWLSVLGEEKGSGHDGSDGALDSQLDNPDR